MPGIRCFFAWHFVHGQDRGVDRFLQRRLSGLSHFLVPVYWQERDSFFNWRADQVREFRRNTGILKQRFRPFQIPEITTF